ncbi:VOC family protein [Streptococcus gallinaceus]|uniref:Catechol 2,3-dioxygenase n=1 Tax=Streptococcus gallinaceus TaxID=165758 RepID=A0ABV2JIN0_9STRE
MYQSEFELGLVAINVKNMELQTLFYQQVLGLEVLDQSGEQVDLGVGDKVLVRLIQTDDETTVANSYGLCHLAIVLPSREDLGQIFKHFIDNKVPLVGASDHGYSEAIYLEDTEGNGIEIYRDLPVSEWDIREDGRIVGITEPMDSEAVYRLGQVSEETYHMPVGSRMGHVHLAGKNSRSTASFLEQLLHVQVKFSVPTGYWLASGDYHHHLAVNEWGGKFLQVRESGMRGLAYFVVEYQDAFAYKEALKRAQEMGLALQLGQQEASVRDENGIQIVMKLV